MARIMTEVESLRTKDNQRLRDSDLGLHLSTTCARLQLYARGKDLLVVNLLGGIETLAENREFLSSFNNPTVLLAKGYVGANATAEQKDAAIRFQSTIRQGWYEFSAKEVLTVV
ncbi:hypothetical protein OC845_006336 [Tilletia horrida]|nr:hypothetical protein OC845_006336 [Tilletia horrida]